MWVYQIYSNRHYFQASQSMHSISFLLKNSLSNIVKAPCESAYFILGLQARPVLIMVALLHGGEIHRSIAAYDLDEVILGVLAVAVDDCLRYKNAFDCNAENNNHKSLFLVVVGRGSDRDGKCLPQGVNIRAIRIAEGHPSALGGRPLWEDQLFLCQTAQWEPNHSWLYMPFSQSLRMRTSILCYNETSGCLRLESQAAPLWSNGVVCRLAAAASLPLLTCVALSRGQDLEGFLRQLGKRRCQLQKHQQQVHRQITSLRRRRRCRLAGLTPLAYVYSTGIQAKIQTHVLVLDCSNASQYGKAA